MDIFTFGLGYQSMSGEKWDDGLQKYSSDRSNQTLLTTINLVNVAILATCYTACLALNRLLMLQDVYIFIQSWR